MSWDIKQDLTTGDWAFDSRRDLQSVEAEYLIQQRVHVRLMVERGEFIYDRTGQLGSRLRSVLDMGMSRGGPALEMLIREALEPMDDVLINDINIYSYNDGSGKVTDPRVILAQIRYNVVFALTQDTISLVGEEFTTDAAIQV